ncbi:hypothetical protein BDY19DRAFT_109088 [Irpex rosettiformis]|uniref:Uncharacterized protein n=1 Tax=Irpex rosettiformis TaxID=378272 RepID=A0ACB8U5A2_9APHY|nr:hypothetical protein BDY19DRAFT_109088 [Irpex rosettiformis]
MSFQLLTKDCFLFHFMEFGKFITEVYTLKPSSAAHEQRIHHIATLQYPELRLAYVRAMGHRSFTARRSRCGHLARNAPPPPFLRSERTQLLMIHRSYGNSSHYALLHCVPISLFTSLVENMDYSHVSASPSIIPWDSWGPRNSRCFLDKDSCIPANFGHRILRPNFRLLDFNRLEIARDLQRAGKTYPASSRDPLRHEKSFRLFRSDKAFKDLDDVSMGTNERIVRHPTVIRNDILFDKEIVTMLPYRETRLDWNDSEPLFLFGGETWVACTMSGANAVAGDQTYHLLRRHAS